MANDDKKSGNPDKSAERPRKAVDRAKPLAEEIEEEMLDQDIPIETGVRPATDKRPS